MDKFLLGLLIGWISMNLLCYCNIKDYNKTIKSQKPFGLQASIGEVYQCKALTYATNTK